MSFVPILRAQVARRLPTPVNFRERIALELDGFSEYASEVTPQQQQQIEDLAAEIVKSNDTNDPIFEFRVEGHADIARRFSDPNERRFQEENVSNDRAQTGLELLRDALKKKGGEALAQKIVKGSRAFGLGTRDLRVPNATTEAEFRRNRRVVFVVRQVTFIPAPPEPPAPPRSIIEDRFSAQLIRSATFSGSPTTGVEGLIVKASIEIVDKIDRKRALFDVTAVGGGFSVGPFKGGGSVTLGAGPVKDFKTFRLLGAGAGNISLKSFEGAVTVFVDISAGVATKTKGGTLRFVFDGLQANGANTQPTIIELPGADDSSAQVPGISFGDVTVGTMKMSGTPSSL
jgi:hypothetical protein